MNDPAAAPAPATPPLPKVMQSEFRIAPELVALGAGTALINEGAAFLKAIAGILDSEEPYAVALRTAMRATGAEVHIAIGAVGAI